MALSSPRPNTLEPLPGEAAKPPLRLLEAREALRSRIGGPPQAPSLSAPNWLQAWRRWVAQLS